MNNVHLNFYNYCISLTSNYKPLIDLVFKYFGIENNENIKSDIKLECHLVQGFSLKNEWKQELTLFENENSGAVFYKDNIQFIHNYSEPAIITSDNTNNFLIKSNTLRSLFINTYKLIRVLFTNYFIENGAVMLHASAVASNGIGVLFVGEKGSGKTSFMIESIKKYDNTQYISNDQVLLYPHNSKVRIITYPGNLRVGFGTVINCLGIKRLRKILTLESNPAFYLYHRIIDRLYIQEIESNNLSSLEDKLNINVSELKQMLDCKSLIDIDLDCIIFPKLKLNSINKLSPYEKDDIADGIESNIIPINQIPNWPFTKNANHKKYEINKKIILDRIKNNNAYELIGSGAVLPSEVVKC